MHIFFIIFLIAFASAEDGCLCEAGSKEVANVFEFLNMLDKGKNIDDTVPVPPGLLSPLVNCICKGEENNRKKRKILPEPVPNVQKEFQELPEERHEMKKQHEMKKPDEKIVVKAPKHEPSSGTGRHKCPVGYSRIGFMCLQI